MYCTTQTNYQNNKGGNQLGSCWRYSICSKTRNIKYRPKSREFEYGITSKGLVQSLKNKIINIQNESFKQRNNRKPSTKKQQKDYYCLMLRKISTLDRKLQNLEDLVLTHLDYETEQALSSRDSKTINCKYLNFHDSISTLLKLANKLKIEMDFRKHNMQGNNEISSEIYNKILALESELQDFSSYLEHLQRNAGARGRNLSKSFSQEMLKKKDELNDKLTIGEKLKSHDSGKKFCKEPVVIKNISNNSKHGFKEVVPVSVNLVQTRETYGSPFDECQCLICSNLTHLNHQNGNTLKGNHIAKNRKYKKVKDESDCSCNLCNSAARKKRTFRNRKIDCDEYKTNDNLSICSCSSCENGESKNNNIKRQKDIQLFHNFWCACSENNKDCFHRTQKTFIRRGTHAKPFYNAVEVSCLQPKPNNTKFEKTENRDILRHRFENDHPVWTHSNMESPVDSFEDITNTKNFKQMQTNPAVINHKNLKYEFQDSKSRRKTPNETLTNDIVYYDVIPEKAKNVAKGTNHKKPHGYNEGKTKQFIANSYQKRCTDHLAKQGNLRENRNSNVGNVKATHHISEKNKRASSKNYNSPYFNINKLRKCDDGSNSLDSGSDISTINESCYDGIQIFPVCNRNSKLGFQILQNTSRKTPCKTYFNENGLNMLIKQHGEKTNEHYYNTPEFFEDDFQNKSRQYRKKRKNNFYKKEPNNYNQDNLGRKHNSHESKNNKNWKSGNISESLETVHLKDINDCKYDRTFKGNLNHVDLTTELKEKYSSSSRESSGLRKFVDKLNEMENDVCDKCIIKEKKIKVPPRYMKHFNCKNRVKIIIKKEIIRCSDCTSKLDSNVFNVYDEKPKTELNQKLYSTSCNERSDENKGDHSIALTKNDTDGTNIYIGSNKNRHLNNSIITTENNGTQNLGNGGASVSIIQTNLNQDKIFTNPTKSPGSQKSSTNISASYKKGIDVVSKSNGTGKSNELISEATAQFKKNSPVSVKINKMETSMNGIVNTSYLSKLNDEETKNIVEENTKTDNLPSLPIPPLKTVGTLNKRNYSNGIQTNLHDNLYNDRSEIVYEMTLATSHENLQSYTNEDNGENKNNKFISNKIQNQNDADSITLVMIKNSQKNEKEKDIKPDIGMDQLEETGTLHNMYKDKPKQKGKNRFKDFNSSLDKHIVNNRSPIKKRNIAIKNNNFAALQNNTVGPKGYNYSNNVPHIQILNSKNNGRTPFANKYKILDDNSKCNCPSSSSTSKGSSFTVPSRYNLNASKRVGLKRPIRPTFNVGRRSSKPLKYCHINYCRQPSRTMNQINKPALDYAKLTQSPDVVPQYEFTDNSNKKCTTTVTSESSFSVVNWATIAQKLKKEKY